MLFVDKNVGVPYLTQIMENSKETSGANSLSKRKLIALKTTSGGPSIEQRLLKRKTLATSNKVQITSTLP